MQFMRTVTIVCLLAVPAFAAVASDAPDPDWPREFSNENGKLVLYQPQVTSWDDFSRLDARIALAFALAAHSCPCGREDGPERVRLQPMKHPGVDCGRHRSFDASTEPS